MSTLPITVRLRYQERVQRATSAWFVTTTNSAQLLAEMAEFVTPQTRVFPMERIDVASLGPSRSAGSESLIGLFVLHLRDDFACDSVQWHEYGVEAGRLYLPVEAELDPLLLTRANLRDEDSDEILVWHPAAGLRRYPLAAGISPLRFVSMPRSIAGHWNAASPGAHLNERLHSISLRVKPDVGELLDDMGDGIGTKSPSSRALPPSSAESPVRQTFDHVVNGINGFLQKVITGIARMFPRNWKRRGTDDESSPDENTTKERVTPQQPGSADQAGARSTISMPSSLRRVADWLQRVTDRLQEARERELRRLMELLEKDPAKGLEYAVPVGEVPPGRGIATPSDKLARRHVDYSSIGRGGGPSDFWQIRLDFRQQLMRRYRELANRELALGCHRRAAYIFAVLLGDFASAAKVLMEGRFYHEAAAIYENKLKNLLLAARCFEQGGLLTDAISIYESLGEYEKVGDLYRQLQTNDMAIEFYRKAVDGALATGDYLRASAILEKKLDDFENAFTVLMRGWPNSRQANDCLEQSFRLLEAYANHDRATSHVRWLRSEPNAIWNERVALILAGVAKNYPDANVRTIAADTTRVLVSNLLEHRLRHASGSAIDILARLESSDRLFRRDCERYVQSPPPIAQRTNAVKQMQLPEGMWKAAVATGELFYAAGFRGTEIIVTQGRFMGAIEPPQSMRCNDGGNYFSCGELSFCMAAPPDFRDPVIVHALDNPPLLGRATFRVTSSGDCRTVEGHPLVAATTLAVQFSSENSLAYFLDRGEPDPERSDVALKLVVCVDRRIVKSMNLWLPLEPEQDDITEPQMVVTADGAFMSFGTHLVQISDALMSPNLEPRFFEMHSPIFSLASAIWNGKTVIALALRDRSSVIMFDRDGSKSASFALGLEMAVVGMNQFGDVVVASNSVIEKYSFDELRPTRRNRILGDFGKIVAVLPTELRHRFAILSEDGTLRFIE